MNRYGDGIRCRFRYGCNQVRIRYGCGYRFLNRVRVRVRTGTDGTIRYGYEKRCGYAIGYG